MHDSHSPFIQFLLIVVLVLDERQVDEVPHICARVPPYTVRIDVDLP